MGKTLLDLPPEIQSAVVSWILHPEEIARVCLVCRQLYDVSMPVLYHSMYLNVDRWKKEHLGLFLARGHRGHQHVRSLDIDSDNLDTEPEARAVAKEALQVLPRNCLTSFRCPLENGIDNDIMIFLSSTQINLTFLSLGPLEYNALNIPDRLRPWPRSIRTIVIPWKLNVGTDIEFYQKLIERTASSLNALTVRSDAFGTEACIPADLWEPNASDTLARDLFQHILNGNRPKLELSDLNLQNQNLLTAGETWLRAIDFTKLRTLQLWNCSNADTLLALLRDLAHVQPMRLYGLVLSFEDPRQAPTLALDFVAAISGLSYLNLCYCPDKLPERVPFDTERTMSTRWLLPHKDFIKDLYIGVGANDSRFSPLRIPEITDLMAMTSASSSLRQLAIAMPPLLFTAALAGYWGEYGRYLEELLSLPKLKILRILTWPIISDQEYLSYSHTRAKRPRKKKIYLRYLDIIATSIARLFSYHNANRHQRLSVIIFGSAEQRDAIISVDGYREVRDHFSMGPISYKVIQKNTEFGSITKAKRIDSNLMEYEEPIAYVVDEDTDQGLSLESYSWGS